MSFLQDLYKKIRATLVIQGDGVSRVDTDTLSTVTIDPAAGLAAATPGSTAGEPMVWTGTAWAPSTAALLTAAGLDLQGNPLTNFYSARGDATSLPGTASGYLPLDLNGGTASIVLDNVLVAGEAATVGVRVRVEDTTAGANPWADDITIHLRRYVSVIAISDGENSADNGATAQLTALAGADSTYLYQVDVDSAGAGTLTVSLTDDNAVARTARVTMWWDKAQVV